MPTYTRLGSGTVVRVIHGAPRSHADTIMWTAGEQHFVDVLLPLSIPWAAVLHEGAHAVIGGCGVEDHHGPLFTRLLADCIVAVATPPDAEMQVLRLAIKHRVAMATKSELAAALRGG